MWNPGQIQDGASAVVSSLLPSSSALTDVRQRGWYWGCQSCGECESSAHAKLETLTVWWGHEAGSACWSASVTGHKMRSIHVLFYSRHLQPQCDHALSSDAFTWGNCKTLVYMFQSVYWLRWCHFCFLQFSHFYRSAHVEEHNKSNK